MHGSTKPARRAALPFEVVAVWILFAVVACEIAVTYWRLPPVELYHTSHGGLQGAASRVLVFGNFPTALVALALLAVLFERLPGRALRAVAVLAAVLCCTVFGPGVVDEANLDAKPVNALAAVGVLLTLVLTAVVARRSGISRRPRQRGDRARIALTTVLLVLALPWLSAELGFYLNDVPVLGGLFQTGEYRHRLAGLPPFPPAVHHGHHHGMDGVLLALCALLLSRALGDVRTRRIRTALTGYLALMFCYGVANIANDFWIEQVWKRHWTAWQIPDVLRPRATVAWGIIVVATAVLWSFERRRCESLSR